MGETGGLTRKQYAAQTKRALFERGCAFLSCIDDPDDFVVEDITDACDVSKGTFYLYYKSKRSFFYQVKAACGNSGCRELADALRESRLPPTKAVLQLVEQWVLAEGGTGGQMGKTWFSLVSEDREAACKCATELHNLLVQRLTEGIECGEFVANMPLDLVADSILVVAGGVGTHMAATGGDLDLVEWARQAMAIVQEGVLRRWMVPKA